LLYGFVNDFDLMKTGRLASVLGAIKVASKGTQNHNLNRQVVETLYEKAFAEKIDW